MDVEHIAGILFALVVLPGIIASRILFAARTAVARRRAFAGSKLPASSIAASGRGHGRRVRILAILGSGGHTAEMLKLVSDLNIKGDNDNNDIMYFTSDERSRKSVHYAHWIPRARYVGESFIRAAPRAFVSLLVSIWLLLRNPTDVILCNGPATGAIVCFSAVFLNALGISNTRIIYLESVARVTSLSLTGKLLYPVTHRFLVQWPQLRARYPASEYHGRYT